MIYTEEHKAKLQEYLNTHELCSGLGDFTSPCSIAAINIVISDQVSHDIPDCMSFVAGLWIIRVQDLISDDLRNSSEWKQLLVDAAGTGRDNEQERLALVINWMWGCLGKAQDIATALGYGQRWAEMLVKKDLESIRATREIGLVDDDIFNCIRFVHYGASALLSDDSRIIHAVAAVGAIVTAIAAHAGVTQTDEAWQMMDTCGLLRSLIDLSGDEAA